VWPTANITELCVQLTASSVPENGDEHQPCGSSAVREMLTVGSFPLSYKQQ